MSTPFRGDMQKPPFTLIGFSFFAGDCKSQQYPGGQALSEYLSTRILVVEATSFILAFTLFFTSALDFEESSAISYTEWERNEQWPKRRGLIVSKKSLEIFLLSLRSMRRKKRIPLVRGS